MGQVLLLGVVALTVAAVVFGVTVLVSGRDPGLVPAEPDGRAVPLPGSRPLHESDVGDVRFDTALRGYRMAQVDQAMRRAAYDIGYKSELIAVLEAEVQALREGRTADAEALRQARAQSAGAGVVPGSDDPGTTAPDTAERSDRDEAAADATEQHAADDEPADGRLGGTGPASAGSDDAPAVPTGGVPAVPVSADTPTVSANGGPAATDDPADGPGVHGPVVRSESA